MNGLVNRALQQMVTTHHGEDAWHHIPERADLQDPDFCLTSKAYPDDVTHRPVAAATEELGPSGDQLMQAFGAHWITSTTSTPALPWPFQSFNPPPSAASTVPMRPCNWSTARTAEDSPRW